MDTKKLFGLKRLLLAMALAGVAVLGNVTESLAQTKLGYFDTNYVLSKLPEFKKAQTAIKTYTEQIQKEAQKKQAELQAKFQEYDQLRKKQGTPPAILKSREEEIQRLQQELQQFTQAAQQQVVKKENAILTPIYRKIQTSIEKIAKANNYAMVMKKEAMLFELPQGNISDLVLKDLGVAIK
ncbi:MAG TPA: hypothetical protein DCS93_18915 [Microscillaceae bacterium]|nr:hypothetical protein [Microscillaceae bacterium]